MHIHILGICGTFMGGAAVLARQLGHKVTGSDANVYPPMSTLLESQGIDIIEGFDPSQLEPAPDLVVIGNAMSRGNPCVEHVLNSNLRYTSGPQWLQEFLLHDRWVLAVCDSWQNHDFKHVGMDFRRVRLSTRILGWRGIRKLWCLSPFGRKYVFCR